MDILIFAPMLQLVLYNLFIQLYRAAAHVVALFSPKAQKWVSGRKNWKASLRSTIPGNKPVIWMHCASLGEFEQGRPVFEQLKTLYPDHFFLLTFFSPSGYEVRKNYAMADLVVYLPFGGRKTASDFLDIVKPVMVIWVKYEYWYHYLRQLRERNIPVYLISAIFRPSQPFFKFYGGLHRKMLNCFAHLFVQDEQSLQLLKTVLPEEKITVCGDTRFDRVIQIAEGFSPLPEIEDFINGRRVLVAGSTWQEDIEVIDHFANTRKDICFIIAPHETDLETIVSIKALIPAAIAYSIYLKFRETSNVLVIDNIGMLSKLYHYADICYIGGGFGNGIHNTTEAAVYGKPLIFGPNYKKFREAVDMVKQRAAFPVNSALEFEAAMEELLENGPLLRSASEAAGKYVMNQKGATRKILEKIMQQSAVEH